MSANRIMPTTEAKDLLLEDYRFRAEMMRQSETAGETRVNLFIVLMTVVSAALVSLVTSERRLDKSVEFIIEVAALGGLLVFGWLTLLRLIKRNKTTDECKHSMDVIRQLFKDRFDDQGVLLGYYPVNWPTSGENTEGLKRPGALRSFGGLAHLVAALNALLAAGLFAATMWTAGQISQPVILAAGALSFVVSFLGQVWYTSTRERRHKDELRQLEPTHAGGVVVKHAGDQNHYLLVRPKLNNDQWVLPKGHIEHGEGHGEAALREVKEEAGVIARLLSPLGHWNFTAQEKRVRLKVYLMAHEESEPGHENRDVHWANANESIEAATHAETKECLKKAHEIISEQTRVQPPESARRSGRLPAGE
jgi:ADP-ribose pyrophosphatase YjhB (NUDIX family)